MPELRPYQREDCEFLKKYRHTACFNQQRTGKTPTSIISAIERGLTYFIVVCPASAIYQWAEEINTWANVPTTPVIGTKLKKQRLVTQWNEGALIISYDTLKPTQRSDGFLQQILNKKPQLVILDEAHRIKDRNSANAKTAFILAKTIPYRLALTGTPAPNKPQEIWSILHFLYPTQFSSYWKFINQYFYTYKRQSETHTFTDIGTFKPGKQLQLQSILAMCATQRKRKDVMKWLPEEEPPIKILLPPNKEQIKSLTELELYYETEHVVCQGTLDRLIRYRQICLHPALLNLKGSSPKLDWIHDYLADYPNRPTIIFSKFTSFLQILAKSLTKFSFGIIVGATPLKQRNEYIQAFQKGNLTLLLINIDAGKEALTLDRAEAIIFTDKYPPIGDIEQATDRIIATTPDKADIPKYIYELIIKNTYDEELYKLLAKRASAVDAINNFHKYLTERSRA